MNNFGPTIRTSSSTIRGRVGSVSNDRICPVKEGARAHRGDAEPTGRRFDMMKSAFERPPLLTRNRSHNRPRTRILFRRLVLSIAHFPDNKQLLARHTKRDEKFACRDIKGPSP